MGSSEPPLCVDLDGTLIREDTLRLSVVGLLRRAPWLAPCLPLVLLRGRAPFKAWIARRFVPDPATLTWRSNVVDFVRRERARGRKVVLATAAHVLVADAVARYLGLFDVVVATTDTHNAKAGRKVESIRKSLGDNMFDYIGDSVADLPVFRAARISYAVEPSPVLLHSLREGARLGGVFTDGAPTEGAAEGKRPA
ncbi:MAG: haloacid dehalogenase-like hydrolase [Gemmatimonadaceae bacterium]|nr:haloacid dehalogenase-like hydrolase [Gemmatimonadaceae bacterium]